MKKLAIIGASYLQNPLILKAKEMGIETHVFAWKAGDIGESTADFFYPISIVEKEAILAQCRDIGIDGITTIGSDLATIPVGYVAEHMGLVGNSTACIAKSTDKSLMRRTFETGGDPSPRSVTVKSADDFTAEDFAYPIIVKPSDRSGSRGVTKLTTQNGLREAIDSALKVSFSNTALVEEFAEGDEYSVEFVSWRGEHRALAITEKFTTGAPHFIETGHLEPARINPDLAAHVFMIVSHALSSLGIEYGASHSEVKIDSSGNIKLIEVGARMGGDFIGSDLVQLSTGYDFVKAVVQVALGEEPAIPPHTGSPKRHAGVRFVFDESDVDAFDNLKLDNPEMLVHADVRHPTGGAVSDSSTRFGYFLFASDLQENVERYLPGHTK